MRRCSSGKASPNNIHFNPRTPCGVRQHAPAHPPDRRGISIHAPHAGCDNTKCHFNCFIHISIHAPHAGCDDLLSAIAECQGQFQSTHPMRGATMFSCPSIFDTYFNPRTPCGVRPLPAPYLDHPLDISIHAPHAGCDDPNRGSRWFDRNFNPRTPCGVRRKFILFGTSLNKFQSTHPMRGATPVPFIRPVIPCISIHAPHAGCDPDAVKAIEWANISIHAPHAGCDHCPEWLRSCASYFNPRTPCGVRPALWISEEQMIRISIHAPHAGCDQSHKVSKLQVCDFNPRTPCGVRLDALDCINGTEISIHAPHAGCDYRQLSGTCCLTGFQSTHPMRGATILEFDVCLLLKFQSTHPMRGATGIIFGGRIIAMIFQSTHPMRGATRAREATNRILAISIHAPHAGCDAYTAPC